MQKLEKEEVCNHNPMGLDIEEFTIKIEYDHYILFCTKCNKVLEIGKVPSWLLEEINE